MRPYFSSENFSYAFLPLPISMPFRQLGQYVVDEAAHQAHLDALDEIENALDAEFGTISSKAAGSDASDEEDGDENYCIACEKAFKSS